MKNILGTKSTCHSVLCLPACPRAWLSVCTVQVHVLQRAASVYSCWEFAPQAIKYLPGTWYMALPTVGLFVMYPSLWGSIAIIAIKRHNESWTSKPYYIAMSHPYIHQQSFLLDKLEIEKHYIISDLNTVFCIWIKRKKKSSVGIMQILFKEKGVYLLRFVLAEYMLHVNMFFPELHKLVLIKHIRTKATQHNSIFTIGLQS